MLAAHTYSCRSGGVRAETRPGQKHERTAHKDLVDERIEYPTQLGDLIALPRVVAVQKIGGSSHDERRQPHVQQRRRRVALRILGNDTEEDDRQHQPRERNGDRQIHDGVAEITGSEVEVGTQIRS